MAGDHLAARQAAYATLARHSLTDTDSPGLYYRSTVTSPTWNEREAASRIYLPRMGRAGVYLSDVAVQPYQAPHATVSTGVTLECVFSTTSTGYNFFGGEWIRGITAYRGPYAFSIAISYRGLNDSVGDTQGRAFPEVADIGQDRIASRTVHSRRVISDGVPHHIAMTHAGYPTLANAVRMYVDGVLTETCTLKSGCEMFALEPNCLFAGVEAYFTQPEGSVSHVCLTPQVLGEAEIRLRAGLVSGAVLPDCGSHLTWTGTRWVAAVTNGTFRFPV